MQTTRDLAMGMIASDPVAYMRAIERVYAEMALTKAANPRVYPKESPNENQDIKPVRNPRRIPRVQTNIKMAGYKYCSACGEKFASNGRSITCSICSAYELKLLDRILIFERDNFTCVYCGEKAIILHIDHVHPVSLGGQDNAGNLVTACPQCNCSKSANPLDAPEAILDIVRARNIAFGLADEKIMVIGASSADDRRQSLRTHVLLPR